MRLTVLDRFGAAFAGADAEALFERQDENFPIADSAFRTGTGGFHNRVDRRFDDAHGHGRSEFHDQHDRHIAAQSVRRGSLRIG